MPTMAGRDPVLNELQDQPKPESRLQQCHWHCAEHQAGHAHRHSRKTQLPRLALFNEGVRYHPTDTNALPTSHLSTKARSRERRAFPSMFRELATGLQHQKQDQTQSTAAPITCPRTPSPTPGDEEGTVLARQAPTGSQRGGGTTPEHLSQMGP